MWEIRLRIPSPKTLFVLYVMVNLINVKTTSIAVAVALIMLFCENNYASQWSEIRYNTYSKALATLLSILSKCVAFAQQPWRGSCTPETESRYTLTITIDIADWNIRSVGGLSIVLSSKPTRTSTNFDHHLYQSEIKFYKTYLPSWDKQLVWLEFRKVNTMTPLAHFSSPLTNRILVPDRSKAQDQQNLYYQCI